MLSRVYQLVLFVGLLLQPLIFRESSRAWFILHWIEIVVLLGFVLFLRNQRKEKINLKIVIAVFFFVAIAVLSSIRGVDWSNSFWGNYYRNDGLFTLGHFIALWLILLLTWKDLWRDKIIKTLAISSLLVSLGAVLNWLNVIQISFNQPVFLAGWLSVCLPALAYGYETGKSFWKKVVWSVGLLMEITVIGLTRTWGGYLGIGLFSLGWFYLKNKPFRKIILILGMLLFILIGFGYQQELNRSADFVFESRKRILAKGLLAWQKRPLLGWGWSNFSQAFKAVDWPFKTENDVYVDKAHSGLLEVLVTTGITGLGLYLLIIFLMARKLSGHYLLIFWLWLIHSQTNITSVSEDLIFWLLLTIAMADYGK